MTVSSDEPRKKQYTGNGVTTDFSFPIYFFSTDHLVVKKRNKTTNEITTLELGTDFTFTGTATNGVYTNGGTVTVSPALSSNFELTITTSTPAEQETDYVEATDFPAEEHEKALDKLTVIIQEMKILLSAAIQLAGTTTSSVDPEMPFPVAGQLIGWNGSANGFTNYDPSTVIGEDLMLPAFAGKDDHIVVINNTEDNFEYKSLSTILGELGFPAYSGNADKMIIINSGATAYEAKTAAEVKTFLSIGAASESVAGLLQLTNAAAVKSASDTTKGVSPGRMKHHPGIAKAWVNFNGTGTVAIRASYNIDSITDNGTGDYTVNLDTDFASANYCAIANTSIDTGASVGRMAVLNEATAPTAGAIKFRIINNSNFGVDEDYINVAFFGDQV